MGIITLEPNGSQDQLTLPGLDHPRLYSSTDAARRCRHILSQFRDVPKTESAVYLAFYKLAPADREFLAGYWCYENDWWTFRHLCRHLQVCAA